VSELKRLGHIFAIKKALDKSSEVTFDAIVDKAVANGTDDAGNVSVSTVIAYTYVAQGGGNEL